MAEFFFINVVTANMTKLLEVSKLLEGKYDKGTLTGINFIQMKDDKNMIGFVFKDSEGDYKEALNIIQNFYPFEKIYTTEENWISLIPLSTISFLGDFSYKMFERRRL